MLSCTCRAVLVVLVKLAVPQMSPMLVLLQPAFHALVLLKKLLPLLLEGLGNVMVEPSAPATYTGVPPGVGVAPTVGVASGRAGTPSALATLMRPKDWPLIG